MRPALAALIGLALAGCGQTGPVEMPGVAYAERSDLDPDAYAEGPAAYDALSDSLRFPGEARLRNVRQLTFGGNNAEAYWSYDGQDLVFQSDWDAINPQGCDQQFVMSAAEGAGPDGAGARLVSTGLGRTTCGYFLPDGRVIYASTHPGGDACPATAASLTGRYVWDIFPSYDVFVADADGSNTEVLIGGEGYDAEATVSPDGRYVVFTSTRSGDLELWRLDLETGDLLQLTDELGYDGGAFFSPDSRMIVWRASRPTGEAAAEYRRLLADDSVMPGALDLYVANADGTDARQVTRLPGANWAPFFHPSGEQILFASNHHTLDAGGREFDLFLVDLDGGDPERVTFSGTFDAFPMFSPDGTRLVFASNRRADRQPSRETNVFVADWVETPTDADRAFVPPQDR
jgi:Tol biopolymer transport system component